MPRWYFLIIPKKLLWSIAVLIFCVSLLFFYSSFPLGFYTLGLLKDDIIYDIMLDAGHGGIDSGAIGQGELYEKHYVLDIVLQMHKILTSHGYEVGLTREHDGDVSHLVDNGTRHRRDLLGRQKLMNQARVGLSVHANSAKDSTEAGALVFYLKDKYIDKIYAQMVYDELEKVQVMKVNYVVPRSTLFLLKAKPPMLLVEIGFMSNPVDLAKITDAQFRTNLAQALAVGILKFMQWRDGEQTEY